MSELMGLFVIKYPNGDERITHRYPDWKPQKEDIYSDETGEYYVDKVVHHGDCNYDVWVSPIEQELYYQSDLDAPKPKTEL